MGRYQRRVVVVALACLFFTAVNNANLGIVSQLASQNDNQWIGPLSIGLIFLGSGIGAIYHGYMQRFAFNKIIFTGALGWDVYCTFSVIFLFIGFEIYVNTIIIIGSLVCGLTVSVFYNGIFNYFNECGKRDRRTQQYFGMSLCIQQSANLLGGGMSSLLIEPLGQKTYSLLMLGLSIVSSGSFAFIKSFKSDSGSDDSKLKDKDQLSQKINPIEGQRQSVLTESTSGQSRKIPGVLFCSFAMSGVMINFVYSVVSVLFYRQFSDLTKEQLNHLTFVTFMIEGCGQFVGGLTVALFSKKIKSILSAYTANGLLFLIMVGVIYIGFEHKVLPAIYIGAFVVGFCDCFCFSLACSIGGHWKEPGISLFNTGQSVTVALLSIPTIFLTLPWIHLIYFIIFVLATIALWVHRNSLDDIHLEHK